MPIMVMGMAIRKHVLATLQGPAENGVAWAAGFAGIMAAIIFVGQIVGKWEEGGWVVLISFSASWCWRKCSPDLAHRSPGPAQIHRIVREKARVQGAMGSIVEWQSLKMQEYRYMCCW